MDTELILRLRCLPALLGGFCSAAALLLLLVLPPLPYAPLLCTAASSVVSRGSRNEVHGAIAFLLPRVEHVRNPCPAYIKYACHSAVFPGPALRLRLGVFLQ